MSEVPPVWWTSEACSLVGLLGGCAAWQGDEGPSLRSTGLRRRTG